MVADIDEEKRRGRGRGHRRARRHRRVDPVSTWPTPPRPRPWRRADGRALRGIDYLVNNAAIFGGMQLDLLLTVDWEYLNRFLSVNMLGALNCVRACYPAMKERGGGAIVNQSSTAAYLYAGFYGLAKAGVNSITQQLAHELGGQNIRTNAIAPGPIDTEASRTVVPDAFMKPILASLALKRQGQPSDLVGHVPVPPVRRGRRGSPGTSSTSTAAKWSDRDPLSEHRIDVEDAGGVRLIAFDRPGGSQRLRRAPCTRRSPRPWPVLWTTTTSGRWC